MNADFLKKSFKTLNQNIQLNFVVSDNSTKIKTILTPQSTWTKTENMKWLWLILRPPIVFRILMQTMLLDISWFRRSARKR